MPAGPDLGKGLSDALSNVLNGLISQLESVTDAFRAITGPAEKFVEALSPGTMQVFHQAIRDLNATIGVGLLPVIRVFTDGFHRAAGILLPLMNKMQPIVQKLSETLSGIMLTSVKLVADQMDEMLPALSGLADIFQGLADGAKVLMVGLKTGLDTIFKAISALFGGGGAGGLGKVMDGLRSAIGVVVKALITAAAVIANTFGARGFVKDLIENLEKASKPGGAGHGVGGALANAQITGLEDFQKQLALAASQAVAGGGGAGAREDISLLRDISEALRKVEANNTTLQSFLKDTLLPLAKREIFTTIQGVLKDASGPVQRVSTTVKDIFEKGLKVLNWGGGGGN